MRQATLLAVLLFSLFPALLAHGGTAPTTLETRLASLASLQAQFQQTLLSAEGEVLEQSSGAVKLLSPGYLSWHIQMPEEQLIIAAQTSLWHYDVELETATRRDIPEGNPASPLTILGAGADQLAQTYSIDAIDADSWRLTPKFSDADFIAVELTFEGSVPSGMRVFDALQRQTVIRFSGVRLNTGLTPEDFVFTPPPGVDVYDDES